MNFCTQLFINDKEPGEASPSARETGSPLSGRSKEPPVSARSHRKDAFLEGYIIVNPLGRSSSHATTKSSRQSPFRYPAMAPSAIARSKKPRGRMKRNPPFIVSLQEPERLCLSFQVQSCPHQTPPSRRIKDFPSSIRTDIHTFFCIR
jgi:hypothetical protein